MKPPTITAYLKPACGWSQGVRAVLQKYNLPYEDRDIINDSSLRSEMVEKSGQRLSPCVEINGHMLADVSGDEVEAYLLGTGLVGPTAALAEAPTNRACDAHHRLSGAEQLRHDVKAA
jgi:glutaredoxin